MKLKEFLNRFGSLTDEAFLAHFQHPALLEEGRLDLEQGSSKRHIYLLRGRNAVRIGRSASADVRLEHDQVSSRHALLFPPGAEGGAWQLMDANSTNGTFLDGKKVSTGDRIPLRSGTLVRFGLESSLTFLEPGDLLEAIRKLQRRAGGDPGPRQGSATLSDSTKHDLKAIDPETLEDDPSEGVATEVSQGLRLLCEPYDPVALREGEPLVVGRTPSSADVVLPHAHVSRRHCVIERKSDGVYVKDLGSSNGCYICGVRVGSAPMLLLPGKPLEIGPFRLVLEGEGLLEPDPSKTQVALSDTATLMGKLELNPLVDLLQAIETQGKTGVLQIEGSNGLSGMITFHRGEPHNARTNDDKWGAEAIRHLLDVDRGTFVLEKDESKVGDRSISLTFGEILLDDFLRDEL